MVVDCQSWIQQYLYGVPKPDSQIYIVNCMGHDPKARSAFNIKAFREMLAEIVQSVVKTMAGCASLDALHRSCRAITAIANAVISTILLRGLGRQWLRRRRLRRRRRQQL